MSLDFDTYIDTRQKMQFVAVAVAFLGFFANAFVLFVMLKTKKIRANSTNYFIMATLTVDFFFSIWFCYYLVRS
jgi:hypothetical protein